MQHPAHLPPLAGALQLTELRSLLDVVVEEAVTGLRSLAKELPNKGDEERWVVPRPGLTIRSSCTHTRHGKARVEDAQYAL